MDDRELRRIIRQRPHSPEAAAARAEISRRVRAYLDLLDANGARPKPMTRNPSTRARKAVKRGGASGRPYILKAGRKVYFATVEAAARAAQRVANALGHGVSVDRDDPPKKKGRRRS